MCSRDTDVFVDYARENLGDVQFELGATGYWEGRVFHTLSKIGPYTLGGDGIDRETRDYSPVGRAQGGRGGDGVRHEETVPRDGGGRLIVGRLSHPVDGPFAHLTSSPDRDLDERNEQSEQHGDDEQTADEVVEQEVRVETAEEDEKHEQERERRPHDGSPVPPQEGSSGHGWQLLRPTKYLRMGRRRPAA